MRFVIAAAVLAAGLASLTPARAVDLAGIEAATFILYANDQAVCSSQVVHSGDDVTVLLTANHCVDGPETTVYSIRDTARDGRTVISYTVYNAKVARKDAQSDLAVLTLLDTKVRLPVTALASVEDAASALFKGADVLAAGYPGTRAAGMADLVFTDGLFTGVRESFVPSVKVDVFRATAPIWYGKSGGALYTRIDGDWQLVGVATQVDPETPWETSLWIPIQSVHKVLTGLWKGALPDLSAPGYTER